MSAPSDASRFLSILPSVTFSAGAQVVVGGVTSNVDANTPTSGWIQGADGKYYQFSDLFKNRGKDSGISLTTAENAELVLGGIDYLITVVDSTRADLGAMQNRLESTVRNQDSIKENVMDSRSRIQDTDFAEDTANLTQFQIIQQATATILTQANQRPQIALSLISGN